ncbi:MAG: hypothetical protein AB3N23_13715 [Paracoccaceae bacterium]
MTPKTFLKTATSITALSFATIVPGMASAQQTWDFTGFIYAWGAGMDGTTTTGQGISMSFGDIVDSLDFALMGALEATNGQWAFFGDAVYLQIAEGKNAAFGPGIPANADARVKGFVFTGGAGYNVVNSSQSRLNAFGGFRHTQLDTTANLAVAGGSRRTTANLTNWDAIIGLRGTQTLSDRWTLAYYADVGTGDSDLTWQGVLSFDYQINNWDLSIGYRHMTWDISNSPVMSDLTFSGPFIGAKFRF